jgi:uncharacterized RDD family membrane protein YckC
VASTPEGIEYSVHPAGLLARCCAYFIDVAISSAAIGIGLGLLMGLARLTGLWLIMLFYFAMIWFYNVGFEIFWEGQTPGKRIMGLRVVMPDGSPVSPGASLLRNLLRFADGFLGLYHIGFLTVTASKGFKRLGDLIGGTLVVYGREEPLSSRLPNTWPDWIVATIPERPLSFGEKRDILSFARRYPLLGPSRADEIADTFAASLGFDPDKGGRPSVFILGLAKHLAGAEP